MAIPVHPTDSNPTIQLDEFDIGVGHESVPLPDRLRDRDLALGGYVHIQILILTGSGKNSADAVRSVDSQRTGFESQAIRAVDRTLIQA